MPSGTCGAVVAGCLRVVGFPCVGRGCDDILGQGPGTEEQDAGVSSWRGRQRSPLKRGRMDSPRGCQHHSRTASAYRGMGSACDRNESIRRHDVGWKTLGSPKRIDAGTFMRPHVAAIMPRGATRSFPLPCVILSEVRSEETCVIAREPRQQACGAEALHVPPMPCRDLNRHRQAVGCGAPGDHGGR